MLGRKPAIEEHATRVLVVAGFVALAVSMLPGPSCQEVHLSHNLFTAAGCRCLVEACVRLPASPPLDPV